MSAKATPPDATSRRERRKQEVRGRIVEAAERLFAAQGFDATTVDQIAEAADVAQKTFFNHFPTKHDLLELLAEARLDRLHAELEEIRAGAGSTSDKLGRFFLRAAEHIEQEDELVRDVILETQRLLAPDSPATSEEATRLQGLIGAILSDGQRAAEVRRDQEVDFMSEMVLGAYGVVLTNWARARHYPVQRRLAQTAAFLGEALAPRAGGARRRRAASPRTRTAGS